MTLVLNATKRTDKQNDKLREAGKIPAVVYAPDIEAISIAIDAGEFEKMYREVGDSTIIDLNIDGQSEPYSVLIHDMQHNPVKDDVLHVDFYKITAGQELSVAISLEFVGQAPAVKLGGTLMTQIESIDVTCLPKDLVDHIDVDLSVLTEIGDVIHVSDLQIPDGITPDMDGAIVVATVVAVQEESEESEERSIDDIQVEEKGKAEDTSEE